MNNALAQELVGQAKSFEEATEYPAEEYLDVCRVLIHRLMEGPPEARREMLKSIKGLLGMAGVTKASDLAPAFRVRFVCALAARL